MATTVAVAAAKPRKMVFGVGSRFFPRSRLSIGYWAVGEALARSSSVKWRIREDLLAEVAEVGDTVYVRPLVHLVEHNRVPLVRVKQFLDLPVERVTVVHYDSDLPCGRFHSSFGGRAKHNAALRMAAEALREEGFARLGVGVGDDALGEGTFVQAMEGVERDKRSQCWLTNKMPHEQRTKVTEAMERITRELTGSARAGSIYDATHRF